MDAVDDEEILAVLRRLSRPHASGGDVIERAAILAEGGDFTVMMAWIADHAGVPEVPPSAPLRRGLHGARMDAGDGEPSRAPARYVLPHDALA